MKVLALCSYPIESAATRYRLAQFVKPLRGKGIDLTVSPFLDSDLFKKFYRTGNVSKFLKLIPPIAGRFSNATNLRKYDLILVQREAVFFGPAFFEWLYVKLGNSPLILDLDDATYVRYISPTYGRVGSLFKFFGKTDKLIKRADAVICGNRFIAEYVRNKDTKTVIIPTVVDTDAFRPAEKRHKIPVVGWIGTHSTFPLLESIFPVLRQLSEKHKFILKVVGSGKESFEIEGVKIENLEWNLEREISDFQSLDIGLYPITTSASASNEWILGKSGFKAIQYLAVGVPYVVSPVGVCAEIGISGKTHFSAATPNEWFTALDRLLSDEELRSRMGEEGRKYSLQNFSLGKQVDLLAKVFQETLTARR